MSKPTYKAIFQHGEMLGYGAGEETVLSFANRQLSEGSSPIRDSDLTADDPLAPLALLDVTFGVVDEFIKGNTTPELQQRADGAYDLADAFLQKRGHHE